MLEPSNKITFRTVTPNDAEQLLEIYAPYVKDTAISFEYEVPGVEEFRLRIVNILKKYPYIAALQGSKIIAYSYAGAFKTREAYKYSVEMTIYVRSDCRRSGVGRQLYALMEKILYAQGILNVNACISYTDDDENPYVTNASMHFHEHEGYRLVGRFTKCGFKFNRWFDMIWMEKLLDGAEPRGCHPKDLLPFDEVKKQFGL